MIQETYKILNFSYELPQKCGVSAHDYKMKALKYVALTVITAIGLSFIYVQSIPLITFAAVILCAAAYMTMALKYRTKALETISLHTRSIRIIPMNTNVVHSNNSKYKPLNNTQLSVVANSQQQIIFTPVEQMFNLVKDEKITEKNIEQFFIENPNININELDKDGVTVLFRAIYARNAKPELITQLFFRNANLLHNTSGISRNQYESFFNNCSAPSQATRGILIGADNRADIISYLFTVANTDQGRDGRVAATILEDFLDYQDTSLRILGRCFGKTSKDPLRDLLSTHIYEFLFGPLIFDKFLSLNEIRKMINELKEKRNLKIRLYNAL